MGGPPETTTFASGGKEAATLSALRDDIGRALARGSSLRAALQQCTEALLRSLEPAAALVWTFTERADVLILHAYSGAPWLRPVFERVELSSEPIGLVARSRAPCSGALPGTDLVVFGQPLLVEDRVVGVVGLFAREPPAPAVQRDLGTLALAVAQFVERKHAEEALFDREERLRLMTGHVPGILWSIDHELRFTSGTGAGLKALDLQRGALVGTSLFEYFGSTDPDFPPIAAARAALQGRVSSASLEWRGKSYEYQLRPLVNDEGRVTGAVGFALDVTEWERGRETRATHELILENAHEAIAIGQEGRFVFCNAKTEEITGYSRAELTSMSFADLLHPDDRPWVLERNRKRQEGEPVAPYTFRALRKDGFIRYVEVKGTALAWQGRPATLTFFSDVTDRELAQAALRESERFKERIADATPGILYIYDIEEGRNVYANREVTATLGYRPEDIQDMGENFLTELAHPDDVSRLGELIHRWETARDGEVLTVEYRMKDKDGEWHWFLGRDTVFTRKPDGRVKQIVGTAQDITEYRQAQEALRQAQKMEGLGVLAGGVAHDFNNLLVAILGNADLAALDLPAGSAARARVEQIAVAASRASELTNQMLAYAGKGRLVVQRLDLSALVLEIAQLLETAVAKRANLGYDLASGLPAVEGDPSQIRQVAMNLITNAAESIADKPGLITVRTGEVVASRERLLDTNLGAALPPGRYVFLEVKDTGAGMDAATRGRIFDPFFTTKFTGRGLGLAATLGIVRAHQGAIELWSSPGQGTSFRVLFPASARKAEAAPLPANDPDAWHAFGTALAVDDDPSVLEVLRAMLEEIGFEVVAVGDGESAVRAFAERPDDFALVVVDLMMPTVGGEEVVRRVRELRPRARVLLSSGYAEADATERFEGSQLAGFIQKPYRYAGLVDAVRKALSR